MYLLQVMLDCQQVCAGGLSITATMGANVGPQMFFLGFNQQGILISGATAIINTMTCANRSVIIANCLSYRRPRGALASRSRVNLYLAI